MVLVHDDDLARLDGICESLVGRGFIQYAVVLMFSYFQLMDGLQSDLLSSHIRSLKPTVNNARIGEFFQYRNVSLTQTGRPPGRYLVCLQQLQC